MTGFLYKVVHEMDPELLELEKEKSEQLESEIATFHQRLKKTESALSLKEIEIKLLEKLVVKYRDADNDALEAIPVCSLHC